MRVLIAARLSRMADGQTGLDSQELEAVKYAKAQGWDVVHVAADQKTGTSHPWNRKNLRPWVTEPARIAQYDAVLAYRLDRLSRGDNQSTNAIEQWAHENSKQLLTADGLFFPCEGKDGIRWDVTKRIAHEEWLGYSEKYRRMQQHLQAGDYLVGRPPYWLRVVAKGDHKTLEPDPVKTGHVLQAIDNYFAGASLRTASQGRWSDVTLLQIFRNPSLYGRRCEQVSRRKYGRTLLKHKGIITKTRWDQLQAELSRRNKRAGHQGVARRDAAFLAGIAVCGLCGRNMSRAVSSVRRKDGSVNRNPYYRCYSGCTNMVRLDDLDAWVDAELSAHPGFVVEYEVIPGTDHADEIKLIEDDIRNLDFDAPDFREKQSHLLDERQALKDARGEPARTEERVAPYTVGDLWKSLDAQQRRAYLIAAEIKVVATKDRATWRIIGDPGRVAAGGWSIPGAA